MTAGVATLTIANENRRNAIDLTMWQALPPLLATLATKPDLRVLLVQGAGEAAFSAGADVSEFATLRATPADSRAYEAANVAAFDALAALACPTIAVIRGVCMGAGAGLALACDLRVAAEDAVFAIPAGRLGVGYPPAAMPAIVAAVGAAVAKLLFFTGRRAGAQEALRLGLVDEVVPTGDLDAHVAALATGIAAQAPLTLTAAKRAIDAVAGRPGALPAEQVQALADACFESEDHREGRLAFAERRVPRFTGR